MNSLSWFIYLIDIVDTAGNATAFLMVVSIIISTFSFIAYGIARAQKESDEEEDRTSTLRAKNNLAWFNVWRLMKNFFIPFAIINLILVIFLPSQRTMYLIMGSEIGEEVVESEIGKKVQDLVNQQLDRYLNPPKQNNQGNQ